MIKSNIAIALLWIFFFSSALADGDAVAGKAKSAVCVVCHGSNGIAIPPQYPNLAGQHASYLSKQLTNYREGERIDALMSPMVKILSDQDILDLAAYFAAMPTIGGVAADENLEQGQAIYRGGIAAAEIPACIGCHGPSGLGNPAARYPRLGGQNKSYTVKQLRDFRSKERHNDPNEMMRLIAHRLTDGEIDAVANYLVGLH